MLHLHECVEPAPAESTTEPLHYVGVSAVVEESAVKPLHSANDTTTAEFAAEPPHSVTDSDAAADALTETSYS
jgi:hypothetical protein